MKAITCTQCGAVIREATPKDGIVVCDYCEASILLLEKQQTDVDSRLEKAHPKDTGAWDQYVHNYKKVVERTTSVDDPTSGPEDSHTLLKVVIGGVVLIVIGISLFGGFLTLLSFISATSATKPLTGPSSTPIRQINYQVKIEWDGVNDMEYYEMPRIDVAKLPSLDEDELKRTVFKDRSVQVSVTIEPTGEVSSAEAISGHPILAEAALKGAKKTIFKPRKKKTSRVLTYFFHMMTE